MNRNPTFILACTRDWHTLDIARELHELGRLELLVTTLPLKRTRAKGIPDCVVRQCRATQSLIYYLHHLGKNGRALRYVSTLFDLETRIHLRRSSASHFLGWAEMCQGSLNLARNRGIIPLLFEGAPHILEQERQNQYWRDRYIDATCFSEWQIKQRMHEYEIADVVVVESEYVKRSFLKIQGNAAREIIVLRPGVDPKYLRTAVEQKSECLRALMIYPAYRKGAIDLIKAWKQAEIGNAFLSLAGRNNYGVRALVAEEPSIRLQGFYKSSADVFPQAQLFVMPTYWDGGPRALMEAAAHGLALISSERCIGPEIIEGGKNGFIVPAGDIDALADRLRWAAANMNQVREMGIRSREIAVERLQWARNVPEFLKAISC